MSASSHDDPFASQRASDTFLEKELCSKIFIKVLLLNALMKSSVVLDNFGFHMNEIERQFELKKQPQIDMLRFKTCFKGFT